MKKTNVFWILAVVIMAALLLASCQKLELATEVKTSNDWLFLKSAAVGEMTSVSYFKNGKIEEFSYPDNILFKVSGEKAEILTRVLLVIRDFNVLAGEEEAFFLIGEINSKPIIMGQTDGKTLYDMNLQNVHAVKLPFFFEDYGLQSATGTAKFNGLLKAENYVFAVKDGRIMIYDLTSSRGNKIITVQGFIQGDVLTFKVNSETWVLKFISQSPIGNIFEFSGGGKTSACYTLS